MLSCGHEGVMHVAFLRDLEDDGVGVIKTHFVGLLLMRIALK